MMRFFFRIGTDFHLLQRTGSGCVIVYSQLLLRGSDVKAMYYASDINPDALQLASATARNNNVSQKTNTQDFHHFNLYLLLHFGYW